MSQGFSLIEILLVLLITAIIGTFALPTYQQYLVRAHRQAAAAELMQGALGMEQYYYKHHSYEGSSLQSLSLKNNDNYTFELETSLHAFTLSAQPTANTDDPTCGTLSINQSGQQTATGTAATTEACW